MTTGLTNGPKLKRANLRTPCPVCQGGGCGLAEGLTLCWRVSSDKQARSGAWIHISESARSRKRYIPRLARMAPLAPIERRDAVYSALLERLPLYQIHADQLTNRRRLSDTTIAAEGFASVPPVAFAQPLVEELAAKFDL